VQKNSHYRYFDKLVAAGAYRSARAAARDARWVVKKAAPTPFEQFVRAWQRVTPEEQTTSLRRSLTTHRPSWPTLSIAKRSPYSLPQPTQKAEREAAQSKRLAKTLWQSLPRNDDYRIGSLRVGCEPLPPAASPSSR
jgi:hypothetical protein